MIRITIKDGTVEHRAVKGFDFYEQVGYADLIDRDGQPLRVRCKINVRGADAGYQPGSYTLAPASVYLDKYGGLALSPRLVPVAAAGVPDSVKRAA